MNIHETIIFIHIYIAAGFLPYTDVSGEKIKL